MNMESSFVTLKLTKKNGVGRPSKEFKRLYNIDHLIPVNLTEDIPTQINKFIRDNNLPIIIKND